MPINDSTAITTSLFDQAVLNGDAYRVSIRRPDLADGTETIIHLDPVESGGTIALETPRAQTPARFDYDVFENADPGTGNFTGDLEVHNMDYDSAESPEATVDRVTSGNLDLTNADKTEESILTSTNDKLSTGQGGTRNIYRNVPTTDVISLVFTNVSGGQTDIAVDLTLYEGSTIPD